MGHKRRTQENERARNLVAKHARDFNSARVFRDRKQDAKRGHRKHKKEWQ